MSRSRRPTFDFAFDDHGHPRVKWSGPSDEAEPTPLLHFLETDLASDAMYARRILQQGRETMEGNIKPWRVTGNAFSLFVGPAETVVTPLYGHPRRPFELPTADFLELVGRWLSHIAPHPPEVDRLAD